MRAFEKWEAPVPPIRLWLKSNVVKETLAARAWEREVAPESPISVWLRYRWVREDVVARKSDRQGIAASPTLLSLKSKYIKEEFAARAQEIAAAPALCIPLFHKVKVLTVDISRCSPKVQTMRDSSCSATLEHSDINSQASCRYDLTSLSGLRRRELISADKPYTRDTTVSSLRKATIPLINKKTCLSSSKYLSSATTEAQSVSLLIIWDAR